MNKNYLVTKSNYFIMNSSYDLSLEEQKLILTLASMVQPEDEEFKPYDFKISDFMELLGVDTKTKYTEIPKITKELMKKVFEIQEGKKLIQTAWLSSAIYEKGTGMVTLKFSPDLKPYMLKLNNMFTQYKLANILNMKSKYSPRIYEFLKCNEFKKQEYIEIDIIDLRKLLQAESIYPKYNDFKRYIIQRAQKELKKLSDIKFEFEEIKTGRKVTSIRFYIKSNIKVKDETSITKLDTEAPERLDYSYKYIKEIKNIISNHKITSLEAQKIYDSARGDLKQIHKVYKYFKNKKSDNFVGTMISMVKPGVFQEPKANIPTDDFNNYSQRQYDFNDLEKGLLEWQNSEE
ncbi:replication initiation protein [Clostridium felsineum]|uniref:replication initiation protein n=1 Tax=Clostridium felsineum TaxID=36839 RepID=UPI00214DA43A|nr:replication initiation protein [Clostridium felsineum]MCR3761740.1 replication initiation protein [Clostridium felsineum]